MVLASDLLAENNFIAENLIATAQSYLAISSLELFTCSRLVK